jgi:serine/threonine protein kinase
MTNTPGPRQPGSRYPTKAEVAAALPDYEIGEELGRGGFAVVFAAAHRRLKRDAAVKAAYLADSQTGNDLEAEAAVVANFDHPHIVRVYDCREQAGLTMIIMERLSSGILTNPARPLSQEESAAIGLSIAGALSHAHTLHVLHRDIKPDNILFDRVGQPKLTDFGIFKIVAGVETQASRVIGTPHYMAPEQFAKGPLQPATDIYALSTVLYEMLGGRPPHNRLLRTPPDLPAGVPQALNEVILRALRPEAAERQQTAHEFALELARAAFDSYGPGWISRSGMILRLDDDVREAASQEPAQSRAVDRHTTELNVPPQQ